MAVLGDALVRFNYDKTQDDELNLRVGDIVKDVIQADEGWCEGVLNGVRGMFPDNFVEIQPKAAESAKGKPKRRARVTFSYIAESPDELSLEVNEIVEILDEEEEGWFKGRLNGVEGVFPNNFVEELSAESAPPITTPSSVEPAVVETREPTKTSKGRPPSMVAMPGMGGISPIELKQKLKPVQPMPPPQSHADPIPKAVPDKGAPPLPPTATPTPAHKKAQVLFNYQATQDDEVSVDKGDIVEILEENTGQDGWWKVRVGNKEGYMPDNFLQVMSSPPTTKPKVAPPEGPDNPPLPPKVTPKAPLPGARAVLPPTSKPMVETPPSPPEESPRKRTDSMGVPPTEILESKTKDRPKKVSRVPSKSNTVVEATDEAPPAAPSKAPWQEELTKRKTLKPSVTPPTATPTPTPTPKPVKPKPKVQSKPAPPPNAAARQVPAEKKDTPISPPTEKVEKPAATASPSPDALALKAALEQLEEKFSNFQKEMREEMQILTEDLDKERKKVAEMSVDIDRLKRSREFRDNLK